MEPTFSGFVSKANLQCADGRTIMPGAFKHQDGLKVPLVYQHNHEDLNQVLGHVILKDTPDGTWGDAFLNETPTAVNAKQLVEHGDIDKFSIWAKNLIEHGVNVSKGDIQEVSLVLAGSNPGANIANVLMHSGLDEDDNIMIVGFEIKHDDTKPEEKPEEKPAEKPAPPVVDPEEKPAEKPAEGTVADTLATLNDDQRLAVNSVIDDIVTEAVTEALTEEPALQHDDTNSSKKGTRKMARNPFDRTEDGAKNLPELKHSDMLAVINRAKESKSDSLRDLIRSDSGKELMHADTYGIDNIEVLFPDAQALMRTPTFIDRRQEWVKVFMNGTSKSPFSRVKTIGSDITADEARAKGYIKATQKKDEVFPVFKRTTGPAMVYKRQKLDRQDIIDIVDFDVVAWMKAEMRGKLDEELARAGLFGDGRAADDPDKVQEPTGTSGDGIRSILHDDPLYTSTIAVFMPATPAGADYNALLDTVIESSEDYMGSGNRTAFMSFQLASKLLTIRDDFGHRIYRNLGEVAGDMDVQQITRVPSVLMPAGVLAIVLDLSDYNFGANRGGEVTLFDDFDIDFNQFKYLIETYVSGAQVLPYCSQVFVQATGSNSVAAGTPTFVDGEDGTGVVTIPTTAHVTYRVGMVPVPAGDLTITKATTVTAVPEGGYTITGTTSHTFTPTDS